MRIRTVLATCAAAVVFAGLSPATTAHAGTGDSMDCSDGAGGTEIVVDDTIVTVAVETGPSHLWLCYSTAGEGTPGQVTGGKIDVRYVATVLNPSARAVAVCSPDYQFGAAPVCVGYAFVNTDPSNVTVTPYPGYVCVLYVGSVCQAHAPGATVSTTSTTPLAEIDTMGQYVPIGLFHQCVSLFVTPCP